MRPIRADASAAKASIILALLARAGGSRRESLSTQELADLARVDEHFVDRVLGNTATKTTHRQDVPDSAEQVAKLSGTTRQGTTTHRLDERGITVALGQAATGLGSAREVEGFVIHINTIKQLLTGRAAVIRKEPRYRWHVVDLVSR